jgi:hypothetical protein
MYCCGNPFSRADALNRHMKSQRHREQANMWPPGIPDSRQLAMIREDFVCMHPFTMIIAGPTGSRKTRWVKTLLENKQIEPFPTNIVWC